MRESQEKLPEFVFDLITDPYEFINKKPAFTLDQIEFLANRFVKQEKKKSNLVILDQNFTDCLIIGDIHGDLKSLVKLSNAFLNESVGSMVFLGDYVDRGEHSLTVLCYVICLAISWPDRVQLLKGNHEDPELNRRYGFEKELRILYPNHDNFRQVQESLNGIYNHISLCALTPRGTFCCHGGIPNDFINLDDFNLIPKPHAELASIGDKDLQTRLISIYGQINWNDPSEDQEEDFDYSYRNIDVYTFNGNALNNFLVKANCIRIVRAHESSRGGFQSLFGGKLLHVFSSEPYFGKIKQAFVIHESVDENTYLRKLNFELVKQLSSE